jgi:hypothetical protein
VFSIWKELNINDFFQPVSLCEKWKAKTGMVEVEDFPMVRLSKSLHDVPPKGAAIISIVAFGRHEVTI